MATEINGINLDVLNQTVNAIKQDGELAQCQFRATNRWINANHNIGRVKDFHAAKQEMEHERPFEFHADEPPILAGGDSAANPVEHLLAALAACVTTSMVAHAAVRGIHIDELESEIEGDIDLRGYLGLSSDVPKGYQKIRVKFTVKSDADVRELRRLAEFSPVFNTIVDGSQVDIEVHKRPAMTETTAAPPPAGLH